MDRLDFRMRASPMTDSPADSPHHLQHAPSPVPRIWALVACAGTGSRAQSKGPKQYQAIAGKPMVAHTLQVLSRVGDIFQTLVVLSPSDSYFEENIAQKFCNNDSLLIAQCGGSSRTSSVFNGLSHLLTKNALKNDWVLVHDAARCLVTPAQVQSLIDACRDDAVGGLLALKLPDTLKVEGHDEVRGKGAGRVASTLDRSDKWLAQTPQMFRIGPLRDALQAAQDAGLEVTDEASAMEAAGFKPLLVPGSAQNFKVTYPEDFALAEAILTHREAQKK